MPWAVPGLQGESVLFHVEGKHALAVGRPVAGDLPQLGAAHVWGDHLREVALPVLLLQDERV